MQAQLLMLFFSPLPDTLHSQHWSFMLADVSVSHPSAPYKSDGATLTDTKGLGRNQLGTFSCLGSRSSASKITACEKSLLKPRDFRFLKCYDRNTSTDARKGRQTRKTGRGFPLGSKIVATFFYVFH